MDDSPTLAASANNVYSSRSCLCLTSRWVGNSAFIEKNAAELQFAPLQTGSVTFTYWRPMITVLLVDDHVPIQKGLRYILEATEDIKVVATASNGVEGVAEARRHCPNVVVMDISMPLMDGIEATRQIREFCRFTRIMMLSILDSPEYIQRAVEVGAVGFVLKETVGRDLLAAVRALARGKRYFSPNIADIAEAYFDAQGGESWAS